MAAISRVVRTFQRILYVFKDEAEEEDEADGKMRTKREKGEQNENENEDGDERDEAFLQSSSLGHCGHAACLPPPHGRSGSVQFVFSARASWWANC